MANQCNDGNGSLLLLQAPAKLHIHDFPQDGWTVTACDTAAYTVYNAVDIMMIKGVEVVQSRAYLMARSRVSYFVRVDYDGEGTYVARINKYLKVARATAEGDVSVLRIAVAVLGQRSGRDIKGRSLLSRGLNRAHTRRTTPCLWTTLPTSFCFSDAALGRVAYRRNLWYFTAYSNIYTKRNPELE